MVIPSPQYVLQKEGKALLEKDVVRVSVCREKSEKISFALDFLAEKTGKKPVCTDDAPELIICDAQDMTDASFFIKENAAEQGYILRSEADKLYLYAKGDMGVLYGIVTIVQLLREHGNVPCGEIRDYPDFRYRANMWTNWCEIGGLSYDYGDGTEKYEKRIIRKLDMALLYKINAIYMDGFGFDADRTDFYASMNRHLSDEARRRGIHLVYGGYLMSYAMAKDYCYSGKAFKNRKGYPDGEIYACIGQHEVMPSRGRENGTCLSNKELTGLKLEEIKDFVRKVHPGALYLHSTDATNITEGAWDERCEDCRKRWPNSDLNALDGAAGAHAEFFSDFIRAIKEVRDGDYDAARDCLIILVSPGYMSDSQTDDPTFEVGAKFWQSVDKYLEDAENVFICHRELFFDYAGSTRRCAAIGKERINTETAILYFSGCDSYFSDKLYHTTPLFDYLFRGTEFILTACGKSFQEPLQLLNAEYMWNAENSAYYNIGEKPDTREDFLPLYRASVETKTRPEGIYGRNGLLEDSCRKLFGKAGKKMADIYRLHGKNYEAPMMMAANKELGLGMNKLHFGMRWDLIPEESVISDFREKYRETRMVTDKAYAIIRDVASSGEYRAECREDILMLEDALSAGTKITEGLDEYIGLYEKALMALDDKAEKADVIASCKKLSQKLEGYKKAEEASQRKPFDIYDGILLRRTEVFSIILDNLSLMIESMKTGDRIPKNRQELPEPEWW